MNKRFVAVSTLLITFFIITSPVLSQDSPTLVYLPITFVPAYVCEWAIPPQESSSIEQENDTLEAINEKRAAENIAPLTVSEGLTRIARFHSFDMGNNDYTEHDGSAGESFSDRIDWVCDETFDMAGEIIGWGFGGSIRRMINWWMNSPGHHTIIMTPDFTVAGIGYARVSNSDWGHYWTVDFGHISEKYQKKIETEKLSEFCQIEIYEGPEGGIMGIIYK